MTKKILQTRMRRQCLDRVFDSLMHCYVRPAYRGSASDASADLFGARVCRTYFGRRSGANTNILKNLVMAYLRSPPNFCNHRFCLFGSEVSISRLRNESAERLKISFLDLGADIRSTDCTVVACLSRNDRAGETG